MAETERNHFSIINIIWNAIHIINYYFYYYYYFTLRILMLRNITTRVRIFLFSLIHQIKQSMWNLFYNILTTNNNLNIFSLYFKQIGFNEFIIFKELWRTEKNYYQFSYKKFEEFNCQFQKELLTQMRTGQI